ncbi:MAG: peptidase [Chitinophagaceae bacterium]|nr:peptidase [Chitinophagaceae bacterium]
MINFIPIFPLSLVAYPGEQVNLHIFEPRYIQLVKECFAGKKPFGIPVVINGQVQDIGTLVEITTIVKQYDDGKMDITTYGTNIFRVLEIIKDVPDKLYYGAIVDYPANDQHKHQRMLNNLLVKIKALHQLLEVNKDFKKPLTELTSYDLAHHVGFSLEQEYELLGLLREDHRLEYIKRHVNKVIPLMTGMKNMADRIKLNGHFKELKGFNFEF